MGTEEKEFIHPDQFLLFSRFPRAALFQLSPLPYLAPPLPLFEGLLPYSQRDSGNSLSSRHHADDAHHDAGGLRQDYIRTAWSKGLKERIVVIRHTIKNALIPVITLIGLQLPILVGGAVIMENIFNLPGLRRLMVFALEERDYPMVSGVNLFFATGVLLLNLLIDLIYPYLDPRVSYE